MARLPVTNSDDGIWGTLLNAYLLTVHNPDGTLQTGIVSETNLDTATRNKLNAVASGGVVSVNSRSGAVTLTKSDVGLTSVDNTSDAGKPISTATQTALDAKAALSHTHTASQISDATATGRSLLTATDAAAARSAIGAGTSNLALGATSSTAKAGDYAPTKSDVGLGNVDNTSDVSKPVSSAQQTALNLKADASTTTSALAAKADASALAAHTSNVSNPHVVTKAQVGLGNVQNQAVIVLGASDPIPGGTPTGTVVIRLS